MSSIPILIVVLYSGHANSASKDFYSTKNYEQAIADYNLSASEYRTFLKQDYAVLSVEEAVFVERKVWHLQPRLEVFEICSCTFNAHHSKCTIIVADEVKNVAGQVKLEL